VRTKQKAAILVEQRLVRDRTEAHHDARALAIELARGVPATRFDPMTAGVVLQPGETVYRQLPIWIRVQENGRWAEASYADVIVTDRAALQVRDWAPGLTLVDRHRRPERRPRG
jgi:hypothetical protein